MEPQAFPEDVGEYLRLHHVVTLGTSSFTGMPHADTVVFTNDDWRMYFSAPEDSALVRNIKSNRYASFTIDDYSTDWRKVRELQGVGRCDPVTPEEDAWSAHLSQEKFGPQYIPQPGIHLRVVPLEMHFVDYDYASMNPPSVTERVFQLEGGPDIPQSGPVSTDLDRLVYEAGQIIFRPGDKLGQYFVVVEGEVEVRGEGFGADQTVVRVGPGQIFGDQAILRGQRGVLTAHAVSRTTLLAVQREAMRDLLISTDASPS